MAWNEDLIDRCDVCGEPATISKGCESCVDLVYACDAHKDEMPRVCTGCSHGLDKAD